MVCLSSHSQNPVLNLQTKTGFGMRTHNNDTILYNNVQQEGNLHNISMFFL